MVKTKQQRALTILILTALAVGVGCGDGNRNKRGKVDRTAAQGKPAVDPKTGLATSPGLVGKPAADAGKSAGAESTAASDTETDKKLVRIYNSFIDYPKLEAKDLEAGTYEFSGSLSTLAMGPRDSYLLRALQTFEFVPGQSDMKALTESAYYGRFSDDGGRNMRIPGRFVISADGPRQIEKLNTDWTYYTKLGQTDGKLVLVDGVTELNNPKLKLSGSLADLVAGKTTDDRGHGVTLHVVKVGTDQVRFIMAFNELLQAPKADDKKAIENVRNIVLTYKFTPADASKVATQAPARTADTQTPAKGTPDNPDSVD